MAEKASFRRSRRFLILSGSLLILLMAGFLFWRNYKYKLVNKKLDKLVTEKSKGLYLVNYKNLLIDEALGNLSAENVEMIPDSLVYQSLLAQKIAPENLFFIHIPKLLITGVKTPKALLNKEISAHIIKIENATIEVRLGKVNKEQQPDLINQVGPFLYQQLLGNFKSIRADSVILENAELTLVEKESKKLRCKAIGLSIRFTAIAIDSLAQNDSSRILFSKQIAIQCNQLELPFKNKVYNLEIYGFDFNSQSATIHTDQIRLRPRLSETAFANSYKFAKDRLDIRIGSLDIGHINRQALLHQQLAAEFFLITDAEFRIFRDKSYPHDSVDRTHDYPQEAIMRLPIPIYIKRFMVKDSYIEYKEKNDKSDSSGKVAFFHVQAKFDNVTNMPEYLKLNNKMQLDFNASFLNKTSFRANIRMQLNDQKGNFKMDVRLGGMEAVLLNPLLKPMALAELDKGSIHGLRYHLDATNTYGKGRLILTYDHISLKLLKKDDEKNKYKTKFLPTLAAGFLLKDSNPQNGKTRIGDVDYKRDIHRSIFNLMWKSLFTGIKKVAF